VQDGCTVNPFTDAAHCGDCSTACTPAPQSFVTFEVCANATCAIGQCDNGYANCPLVDAPLVCGTAVATDVGNCGACGVVCTPASALAHVTSIACASGACAIAQCAPGWLDCNGLFADGCEVDPGASWSCGTSCADVVDCDATVGAHVNSTACVSAACVLTGCAAGYYHCPFDAAMSCGTSLLTNASNCGACGASCVEAMHVQDVECVSGACVALLGTCVDGWADCNDDLNDGCETDITQPDSCGACGVQCAHALHVNASACVSGACVALNPSACEADWQDCDPLVNGCETSVADPEHCGACNSSCASLGGAHSTMTCEPFTYPRAVLGPSLQSAGVLAGSAISSTGESYVDGELAVYPGTTITGFPPAVSSFPAAAVLISQIKQSLASLYMAIYQSMSQTMIPAQLGGQVLFPGVYASSSGTFVLGGLLRLDAQGDPSADFVFVATSAVDFSAASEVRLQGSARACRVLFVAGSSIDVHASALVQGSLLASANVVLGRHAIVNGSAIAHSGYVQMDAATVWAQTAAAECAPLVRNFTCELESCTSPWTTCPGAGGSAYCNVNPQTDANNCGACGNVCTPGPNVQSVACVAGVCTATACNDGFGACGVDDVNSCPFVLTNDTANCGCCGHDCNAGGVHTVNRTCTSGQCVVDTCAAGYTTCALAPDCWPAPTFADANNCGACGRPCNATALAHVDSADCFNSTCLIGACTAGFADCDANYTTGCEVDLATSALNCGSCGNACPQDYYCEGLGGTCSPVPPPSCSYPQGHCTAHNADGCETDLASDGLNCGACANNCTDQVFGGFQTGTCASGACVFGNCQYPTADCDSTQGNGCEVDLSSDVNNCGACGNACPSNPANAAAVDCVLGECVITQCNPFYSDCDADVNTGCEVLDSDSACGCAASVCPQFTTCTDVYTDYVCEAS